MNPKTKAILEKSSFSRADQLEISTGGIVNVGPHDPLPKVPNQEETASSDIQTRLEILKILFSSPHIGPDRGLTTKVVENWVKTGKGEGITFVEWNK